MRHPGPLTRQRTAASSVLLLVVLASLLTPSAPAARARQSTPDGAGAPPAEALRFGCDPGPSKPAEPPLPPDDLEPPAAEPAPARLLLGGPAGPPLLGIGLNLEPTLWSCPAFHPHLGAALLEPFPVPLVRLGIAQAPWEPEGLPLDDLAWPDYQRALDRPDLWPSWEMIAELNARGIAPLVAHWGAPGAFTDDGTPFGRLLPWRHPDYVEFYVGAIDYLVRVRGLQIGAASVMNEPDCGDGSKIPPDEYARLAALLGPRLAAYGVPLYGPDTCNAEAALDYLAALAAEPGALDYFGVVGAHHYAADVGTVSKFVQAARAAAPGRPVIVTEYTSFGYGALDDGQEASDEVGYLLSVAEILRAHLLAGADAALYWDAVDYLQVHHGAITRWGLLRGPSDPQPFQPRRRYYALRQLAELLQPGARVLEVEADGPPTLLPLAVAPAEDGSDPVLALINLGGPVDLEVHFAAPLAAPERLVALWTGDGADLAIAPLSVEPTGLAARLLLPARSLVTVAPRRPAGLEPVGPLPEP